MKLTERILLLMLILGGVAYGIYWCINSGPCGNICQYLPLWLQKLGGLCNGPGPGGAPCGEGGACATPGTLQEFDNILSSLEKSSSTPGCSGSDCVPDQPGQTSGMLSVGGS